MTIFMHISAAQVADYYEQGWTVTRLSMWQGMMNRWLAARDA